MNTECGMRSANQGDPNPEGLQGQTIEWWPPFTRNWCSASLRDARCGRLSNRLEDDDSSVFIAQETDNEEKTREIGK